MPEQVQIGVCCDPGYLKIISKKLKVKSKKESNCAFGTACLVLTGCLGFGICPSPGGMFVFFRLVLACQAGACQTGGMVLVIWDFIFFILLRYNVFYFLFSSSGGMFGIWR